LAELIRVATWRVHVVRGEIPDSVRGIFTRTQATRTLSGDGWIWLKQCCGILNLCEAMFAVLVWKGFVLQEGRRALETSIVTMETSGRGRCGAPAVVH
jgi:hypothetical protein